MRVSLMLTSLLLTACATTSEPVIDPEDHAQHLVTGFREASPAVAELLDGAVAWAVFEGVEDVQESCSHEGLLFRRSATEPALAVVLRCSSAAPVAPAGEAYHILVVLGDPADLELLEAAGLDLSDAAHISPHDDHGSIEAQATRWVVTTSRGGLLFPARLLRQRLEYSR